MLLVAALAPHQGRPAYLPLSREIAARTREQVGEPLHGWRGFQPLWDEIVAEEPDFVTAFLSLPESDIDQEVFTTLAAILEDGLQNHPEFADLHYHCGAVYRRLGRRTDAIAHTELAVDINPRYVNALVQLAELYGQTDQWAMGVERLQQAIDAGGDFPDVHLLLGRLYQAGGQPHRAREAFQHALALNDGYESARRSLEALSV